MSASVPVLGLSRDFGLIRPLNGEIYAWDPSIKAQVQNIKAQAQSVPGVDILVWRLNGRELARQDVKGFARSGCLVPLARGSATLEVWGLKGGQEVQASRISFTVK